MDVKLLLSFIIPALILIVTSFGAKFGTVFLSARIQGVNKKTSLRAGFGLSASGGELALVTAKGGADVGATSAHILPMIGAMTIITTFLSPYVIRLGWKASNIFSHDKEDKNAAYTRREEEEADEPEK
jgi:CPA2 family monovalent cation:H+ antiporter-2